MKLQLLGTQMRLTAAPEPDELTKALNTIKEEIQNCPKEVQQKLINIALDIQIDINKYKAMFIDSNQKIQDIKSKLPDSRANQKYYSQLENAVDAQKQHVTDKSSTNQEIKSTEKKRFNFLQAKGMPMAKNAQEYHELRAEDELLIQNEDNPDLLEEKPAFIKKMFLGLGKISVGLFTAMSLNHIANKENIEILTAALFSAGLGLSILMLAIAQGSAHRAKVAQLKGKDKDAKKHVIALIVVTVVYMITESYLNYEGVISIVNEAANKAANSGKLRNAGEIAKNSATHYSLLIFSLALVGFAAYYSALAGRDEAVRKMRNHKFKVQLAKLRKQQEEMIEAGIIDEPQFLEKRMRPKTLRKPDQKPITRWHEQAIQKLSQSEESSEQTAAKIGLALAAEGARIQKRISDFGNEVYKAQQGRGGGPFAPLKLLKLAK